MPKGASTKSPPAAGFLKLPSEAPLHHLLKLPSSSYLNVGMHVHVYAHVSSCARRSYSHAHMHVACNFLDAASKGSTAERCATGQNCKILQDPSAIVRVCCRAMRWLYSVVRVWLTANPSWEWTRKQLINKMTCTAITLQYMYIYIYIYTHRCSYSI